MTRCYPDLFIIHRAPSPRVRDLSLAIVRLVASLVALRGGVCGDARGARFVPDPVPR